MGSALSFVKRSSVPIEDRVNYIKNSPFLLYIPEEVLIEFAKCFPSVSMNEATL